MEMNDSQTIAAPRQAVWAAINDPETLRRCIPGCESIERLENGDLEAIVALRIGPVKARFLGSVGFRDMREPEALTLVGQGNGGIAGHARGEAEVSLQEQEGGSVTALSYRVHAAVGGKIAQLGARLIDSTAQKLAREFFARLREEVAGSAATTAQQQ